MRIRSILCGLWFAAMAGFCFASVATVMPGFDRLTPAMATEAMQAINAAVHNPVFAIGFWGGNCLAVASTIVALRSRQGGGRWLAGAGALYLVGVLGVTGLGNVPLNGTLGAIVDPIAATAFWAADRADWGTLNLLRMLAAFMAAGLAVGALAALATKRVEHG